MTTIQPTLEKIFTDHSGKVSDKWMIYIKEYDRIFQTYRDCRVRLLEIGIQNGGSLEIWAKFFPNAEKLVGCDINTECAQLQFEDPRISVVVANASTYQAQVKILELSPEFNLIIDDGSHQSGDIISTFARYFTHLTDGGVYVVEDLHCSYWQSFEGGLNQPYSSIAFFKRLADIINHEHWGVDKTRCDLLRSFQNKYNARLDEDTLAHIHSIEFINSMCVIKKLSPKHNTIGKRFVAGAVACVDVSPLHRNGSSCSQTDQSANPWSDRDVPAEAELVVRLREISGLNHEIDERDKKNILLSESLAEKEVLHQIDVRKNKEKLESYLIEMDVLKNSFSQKLHEIQKIHEQQAAKQKQIHTERELALLSQLAVANQKIETHLLDKNEREKAFSRELLDIRKSHYSQNVEERHRHEEREQLLSAQIYNKQNELISLTQCLKETEKLHAEAIAALQHEFNVMQNSYSWRWSAPLRHLISLLEKKSYK